MGLSVRTITPADQLIFPPILSRDSLSGKVIFVGTTNLPFHPIKTVFIPLSKSSSAMMSSIFLLIAFLTVSSFANGRQILSLSIDEDDEPYKMTIKLVSDVVSLNGTLTNKFSDPDFHPVHMKLVDIRLLSPILFNHPISFYGLVHQNFYEGDYEFSLNGNVYLNGMVSPINDLIQLHSPDYRYNLTVHHRNSCPMPLSIYHTLQHNEDPSILSFKSTVSQTCEKDINFSNMTIDIDLQSSKFPVLSTRLDQLFVFEGDSGWEEMKTTNPLLNITVSANWNGKMHIKKAIFTPQVQSLLPYINIAYEKIEDAITFNMLTKLPQKTAEPGHQTGHTHSEL